MKIVHVFKDFYPPLAAGITCYIHDVATWSAAAGHAVEVHVAGVRSSYDEVLTSGVVVHRHREWGRVLSSPVAPALVGATVRARGDVFHVHMPNPAGEVAAFLNAARVPIIVTFHAQLVRQHFLEPMYGPFRRALLRRASAVLVSSESVAAVPELATFERKVTVLPYGVSPRLAHHELAPASDHDRLRLLFVGRLVYYKGVDVLLAAVARTADVVLTVVGEGPLRVALESQAARLGIADRVTFRGGVSDEELRQAYAAHDVFILPSVSRAEAFGMAMVEAMANGLPAVSTEVRTGTSWVNQHGVSGLVVPPNDAPALAAAIEDLRAPDLRARLALGALNRATDDFSFDVHCHGLIEAYERARIGGV